MRCEARNCLFQAKISLRFSRLPQLSGEICSMASYIS